MRFVVWRNAASASKKASNSGDLLTESSVHRVNSFKSAASIQRAGAWRCWTFYAALVLAVCAFGSGTATAQDAGNLFVVSGVKVDARAENAAKAKKKAIIEAQVKAFAELLERLAGKASAAKAKEFTPSQIGRMMASLRVEEERTGPGRYIGKLTIKFLPRRVRSQLSRAGITIVEEQSPPIVVIPLWKGPDGQPVLWQDNPWRTAWQELKAENALVPVLVPLGDLTDTETLTIEDVLQRSEHKFEAIGLRYSAEAVLVAVAESSGENEIHATMSGDSPVGRIGFDKSYVAMQGGIAAAAKMAAERFHAVMVFKWKRSKTAPAVANTGLQAVNIAVPFSSLQEWNALRGQLTITPGVTKVDVTSLASDGALVRVTYAQGFENLRAALQQQRMSLVLVVGTWVLQPY